MPIAPVEQQINDLTYQAERTVGRVNAALIMLLIVTGAHLFATAIYIDDRTAIFTMSINAVGLVVVSLFFWNLAKKPQHLILSINEEAQTLTAVSWIRKISTTKYVLYGLLVLCGSFISYLAVYFAWEVYVGGGSLRMPDFFWAMLLIGLFLLALIICFFLGYQASIDITPMHAFISEPLLHRLVRGGLGILPKKVALGTSHNISFRFTFSEVCGDESIVRDASKQREYVEAELQAAALKIDTEKRLKLCDTSPLPASTWNCHFPESGKQTLNLILSEVNPATDTRNVVFTFTHTVSIKGALTSSIQPVCAITLSIITLWVSLSNALGGIIQLIV